MTKMLDIAHIDMLKRPELPVENKVKGGIDFKLHTDFEPSGDQPTAIAELVKGLDNNERDQVLLASLAVVKPSPWPKLLSKPTAPHSF